MQKWEYMSVEAKPIIVASVNNGIPVTQKKPDIEYLNEIGADGWELVSIITQGDSFRFFLKRLKQ